MSDSDNYQFIYEQFIVKSERGYIYLGEIVQSRDPKADFYFKIPVLEGQFIYNLGEKLVAFAKNIRDVAPNSSAIEEPVILKSGLFKFKLQIQNFQITMTNNNSTYTFVNDSHLHKWLNCMPIMACQAAVRSDLIRPLTCFCHHLCKLENAAAILKEEKQFALGCTLLWDLFQKSSNDPISTELLVFLEINYESILAIIRLQKVLNNK